MNAWSTQEEARRHGECVHGQHLCPNCDADYVAATRRKAMSEAIIWQFGIRLDQNGNLVMIKEGIPSSDLKRIATGDVPVAELLEAIKICEDLATKADHELTKLTLR